MQKSNAIIITAGYLDTEHGKTAHGLIRGTERFNILGIIDDKHPGKDAGEVLDGRKRNIPVFASLKDFQSQSKEKAKYCIIGVATKGGILPPEFQTMLREAIGSGYGIVNGLHDYVSDHPDLMELANKKGVEIIDVRKPKKFKDLHFWSGDIIFIEGQSSLRNPSGPAGAEWIVSADANAVVLQHNPPRKKYKGLEDYYANIADVKDEVELIKIYGAPTAAITVNTSKMKDTE